MLVAVVAVPAFFVGRPDETRVDGVDDRPETRLVRRASRRCEPILGDRAGHGWHVADKPLAPWLGSPYDILKLFVTSELEPSREPSNQARVSEPDPEGCRQLLGAHGGASDPRVAAGRGVVRRRERAAACRRPHRRPGCDLPTG